MKDGHAVFEVAGWRDVVHAGDEVGVGLVAEHGRAAGGCPAEELALDALAVGVGGGVEGPGGISHIGDEIGDGVADDLAQEGCSGHTRLASA
jgi:hypothetical protein